jgi:hypothetical protein
MVTASRLVALVRAGARFAKVVKRTGQDAA